MSERLFVSGHLNVLLSYRTLKNVRFRKTCTRGRKLFVAPSELTTLPANRDTQENASKKVFKENDVRGQLLKCAGTASDHRSALKVNIKQCVLRVRVMVCVMKSPFPGVRAWLVCDGREDDEWFSGE
jgi:hypothetical protein